ncbi:MAG TPA: hypothetical protein VFQ25_07845 [Ktedonobacterales bacterium]|nr:hypothetical protein [Ktedonobacterales bacterium]
MSEASLRQALSAAIIAAVAGLVALVVGAFIAPLPTATISTSPTQVVTALLIRGVLVIASLALAVFLAYRTGYRIQDDVDDDAQAKLPQPDPSASSPLVSMFTTPGPRRDAMFAGAIALGVYWIITSLYIVALGKTVGHIGVVSSDVGSFITQRIGLGLVLVAAGLGCGGLGARAALARKLTRQALMGPANPPISDASSAAPGSSPVQD